MGLFSKIKDLLVDDEEVYETKEVEIEEKEEEHKLPTFMRNKIEKEEEEKKILEEKIQKKEPVKENIPEVKKEEKKENKFPFEFNDEDFIEPTRFSRVTVQKEKVAEKIIEPQPIVKPYGNKKELEKPKKFRPTPVISPVYGVLDKNYKTDEVVSKEEDSYAIQRSSKKVDFEAVRKKAYGTLSDDIKNNMLCENCELLKEIKVSKKIERLSEEDLLYNMTVDDEDKKENNDKDITLEQAKENYEDFGVTYELPPKRSHDDEDVKIVNHALEEVVGEKVEVTEPEEKKENKDVVIDEKENDDKKKSELELTDDLFNLIDSMYKERDE